MRILALECSSVSASVALTENGRVLCSDFVRSGLTHSQTLLPMLEKMLKENSVGIDTVDVFACTAGPGSFTGVRIGVAAVKGLADARNKPCFAVSSLETAAYPLRGREEVVCAVMDARCNQVYTASFYKGERLTEDEAILIDELKEKLLGFGKSVVLTGDGAELVFSKLNGEVPSLCVIPPDECFMRASSAALLSEEKMNAGEAPLASKRLLPVYLRVPQAQRELNNKNKLKGDK